jgi:hypothetical protein
VYILRFEKGVEEENRMKEWWWYRLMNYWIALIWEMPGGGVILEIYAYI